MIIDSIVSSPIKFPKIIPNDWDRWWKLWTKEATLSTKVHKNHNDKSATWMGMNVYVKPGIDNISYTNYNIKNVICPELFPSLFDNLDKFPMEIDIMQVASSRHVILPHNDYTTAKISIRSIMYDNNFTSTFYYDIDGNKKYQTLPEDTNTWIYHDNKYKHGSDYYWGHSKQLIIFHGTIKKDVLEKNLLSSVQQYGDYVIQQP